MSERPTQTPASSASQPQSSGVPKLRASSGTARDGLRIDEPRGDGPARRTTGPGQPLAAGESLAVRAERFRNGAPFLVERATLYDPDPLDLPVAPADRRLHSPSALLPAALTLLGVVIVVGLAAGILFVRNADVARTDEGTGRLEQFSERAVPRPSFNAPSPDAPRRREEVTYDLTRRSNDTIVGAWRVPKPDGDKREPVGESRPVSPVATPQATPQTVSPAAEMPHGSRRPLPRRFTEWLAKQRPGQIAQPTAPTRAPLDDPYVPKASAEIRPAASPRAPLDEPYVPKASAEPAFPTPAARNTASARQQAPEPAQRQAAPGTVERPGANVVARVGRETDPRERQKEKDDLDGPAPAELSEADEREAARGRYASRRAQRAELRRIREARRRAIDLDRFLVRDKGEVPNGFVFSGPQAQRP
ncbi:MAG: hypothetical protein ABI391_05145 [Hyphomicrobiaceae bacterium]